MTIKYKNKSHFLESLLGLKLLEDLLLKTDTNIKLADLRYTPYGKPYFMGQKLFCSLAHSAGMVMAALATEPIGIDLEKVDTQTVFPGSLLHPLLLNDIGRANWIRAWVHQEAVLKLFGWSNIQESLKIYWKNRYEGEVPFYLAHPDVRRTHFRIETIETISGYYAAKGHLC